jgi:hypothetical protein
MSQEVPEKRRDDMIRKAVDYVLRLFQVYEQAMRRTTIKASWNETGFEYE